MSDLILTPEIIEGFSRSVLLRDFADPMPIPQEHREWWAMCCSPKRFVGIAAPRDRAKSTAITHTYGLASLLFRQSSYCLIFAGTHKKAKHFLGGIKAALSFNDDLRKLFQVVGFEKETEEDIIVSFADGKSFRVEVFGSEQDPRGALWNNKRPDLILCDDMENDEQVLNQDRREKFRKWFYGAVMPVLSQKGKLRWVGTILHHDAALERLMPENITPKAFRHLIVETPLRTTTKYDSGWLTARYRAHSPDFSSILWPERFSEAFLREQQQTFVENGEADSYAREYLNKPLAEGSTLFRASDLHPLPDGWNSGPLEYYIACDPAYEVGSHNDYTAFVVGAVNIEGALFIVNVIRQRMAPEELVDTIFRLHKSYRPVLFGLEKGAISKAIGPYIRAEMRKRDSFPVLEPLVPSVSKTVRATSIAGRVRAGAVCFDTTADWFLDFKDELLSFPRGIHDDQVDALAYIGLMLDKMMDAEEDPPLEGEYTSDPDEPDSDPVLMAIFHPGADSSGRDPITGY